MSCGAHMNNANRLQERKKVSHGHKFLDDGRVCVITGYEAVFVTYCIQCEAISHIGREMQDVQHSIVYD